MGLKTFPLELWEKIGLLIEPIDHINLLRSVGARDISQFERKTCLEVTRSIFPAYRFAKNLSSLGWRAILLGPDIKLLQRELHITAVNGQTRDTHLVCWLTPRSENGSQSCEEEVRALVKRSISSRVDIQYTESDNEKAPRSQRVKLYLILGGTSLGFGYLPKEVRGNSKAAIENLDYIDVRSKTFEALKIETWSRICPTGRILTTSLENDLYIVVWTDQSRFGIRKEKGFVIPGGQ